MIYCFWDEWWQNQLIEHALYSKCDTGYESKTSQSMSFTDNQWYYYIYKLCMDYFICVKVTSDFVNGSVYMSVQAAIVSVFLIPVPM